MLTRNLLIARNLRELRAKAAALLARNSFSARTGIFRRQTYGVHRFQTQFAVTFVVLSALHTTVSAMVVYRLLGGPQNGADLAGAMSRVVSLEPQAVWLFSTLLLLWITSYCLLYFIIIVATHRVAGPIVVMQKHLSDLLSGQYPVLRPLRQHDELKDFFRQFCGLVEQLRAKDAEEKKILEQLWEIVSAPGAGMKDPALLASLRRLIDAKQRAVEGAPGAGTISILDREPARAPAGVAPQ